MHLVMSTDTKIVSYPHIEKTPEVRGGKACIEGTRIAVVDIVLLHKRGLSPQEMLGYYARPLSLAQVHSALAYYYDHPEEIEAYFEESHKAAAELEGARAEVL